MTRRSSITICAVAGGLACLALAGCMRTRLIEQFDNGPIGGQSGPSEGYWWVGDEEWPSAGKHWKDTDRESLTEDQEARIRNWQLLWR